MYFLLLLGSALKDAKILHQRKRWRGALYLSGLALECALKYTIGAYFRVTYISDTMPELTTGSAGHHLESLFQKAGLWKSLKKTEHWHTYERWFKDWDVGHRYNPDNGDQSLSPFPQIEELYRWIMEQ
jgi:HEPN domain-containing protein